MSPARKSLDALLALYPHDDIAYIDSQTDTGRSLLDGPWLLIKFADHHGPLAIWKHTGAIHVMNQGAVSDDPVSIEELEAIDAAKWINDR